MAGSTHLCAFLFANCIETGVALGKQTLLLCSMQKREVCSLSLSLESNIEPILWRARFGSRFTGIIARDTLSHFHFFSSLSTFFFLSLSLFHFHSFSLSQTKLQQVYGSWESKACERLLFSLSHTFALSLFHTFTLSAGSRFTGKQRDSFSLSLFHTYTVFSFSLFHTFTLSLFLPSLFPTFTEQVAAG